MCAPSPDLPAHDGARLGDSLRLVLPALDSRLVAPDRVARLTAIADVLAPVHRAGFECRLAADARDVDIQQGVFADDGEPARLARFLTGAEPLDDVWERVRAVAESWASPDDPLHEGIAELWLELDVSAERVGEGLTMRDATPSVFVLTRGDAAESRALARTLLVALAGQEQAGQLEEVLGRCADACPAPARISHVGVMLGRQPASMRVHVSPIPLHALTRYLVRIGWDGDPGEVEALATTLLDHADLLVVCLDVVGDQVVRVGLECFFAQTHGLDPRWRLLLDRLTGLGLSCAEKADALLRWPGVVTPLDSPAPWPEDLIAQSLARPESVLGAFDRRLSHVKLTCTPGASVTAKAYFGYGHVWMPAREAAERPGAPRALRPASCASAALDAGVRWLLAARNQAGWWRDFFDRARPAGVERRVTGYASDEWVTAFVASVLAGLEDAEAQDAARHAFGLLLQRRLGTPGWGYHALLPSDADTTTWVLRLARRLDAPEHARLTEGRELIESLTGAGGGVQTYSHAAGPQLAHFLQMPGNYDGWCGEHACVTAAAAPLDLAGDSTGFLLDAQRPDGSWGGHWWDDDEYTTARAVEGLVATGDERQVAGVAKAVQWSAGRIGPDGAVCSAAHGGPSPFATALALLAVRVGGDGEAELTIADRGERWLLDHQLDDGSWEPSARLRVPPPEALDPLAAPERTLTYVDDVGLFTTATVLAALSAGGSSRA